MNFFLVLMLTAATVQVNAGLLTLEVSTAETAQRFYAVDQLAQWTPYAHKE